VMRGGLYVTTEKKEWLYCRRQNVSTEKKECVVLNIILGFDVRTSGQMDLAT